MTRRARLMLTSSWLKLMALTLASWFHVCPCFRMQCPGRAAVAGYGRRRPCEAPVNYLLWPNERHSHVTRSDLTGFTAPTRTSWAYPVMSSSVTHHLLVASCYFQAAALLRSQRF